VGLDPGKDKETVRLGEEAAKPRSETLRRLEECRVVLRACGRFVS
jgi:hypothetical protein